MMTPVDVDCRLLLQAPDEDPVEAQVRSLPAVIGQDTATCALVVEHPSVAARHARLLITQAGDVAVQSLDPEHPIRVAGEAVDCAALPADGRFTMGELTVTVTVFALSPEADGEPGDVAAKPIVAAEPPPSTEAPETHQRIRLLHRDAPAPAAAETAPVAPAAAPLRLRHRTEIAPTEDAAPAPPPQAADEPSRPKLQVRRDTEPEPAPVVAATARAGRPDGQYAGLFERLGAFLLDELNLFALSLVLGLSLQVIMGCLATLLRMRGLALAGTAAAGAIGLLLPVGYFVGWECSWFLGTPGKRWLGLTVVRASNGEKISLWQALLRFVFRLLSICLLGLPYLSVLFTSRKQAIGDVVAGTVVVGDPNRRAGFGKVLLCLLAALLGVGTMGVIVAAVSLPALAQARDKARLATDAVQMKVIGTALASYASRHAGQLPPDLGVLIDEKLITDGRVFRSVAAAPPVIMPTTGDGIRNGACDYVFPAAGKTLAALSPGETLVHTRPGLLKSGYVNTLKADLSVQAVRFDAPSTSRAR